MGKKCELCDEEIGMTFLDKLDGTMIKTGKGESSKKHYICSTCQKDAPELRNLGCTEQWNKKDLKEKISKL